LFFFQGHIFFLAQEKKEKEKIKILTGVVIRGHSYLSRLERAILL
jgi:hypothetical protein